MCAQSFKSREEEVNGISICTPLSLPFTWHNAAYNVKKAGPYFSDELILEGGQWNLPL